MGASLVHVKITKASCFQEILTLTKGKNANNRTYGRTAIYGDYQSPLLQRIACCYLNPMYRLIGVISLLIKHVKDEIRTENIIRGRMEIFLDL